MSLTYPKTEKLKSRNAIEKLFTQGKSVSKYPLRLVFVENNLEEPGFQIGVSVSKKYFKKATDRNYFKRCLRECYRVNQDMLRKNLQKKYSFMLLYQSADRLSFSAIDEKMVQLFEKFHQQFPNA